MNGRQEKTLKIEKRIKIRLESMPNVVSDFYYNMKGKTASTKEVYIGHIASFLDYFGDDFMDVTIADIDRYMDSCRYRIDNNGNQVALNNSKSDIIRLSNIKNYIAVPIENDDPNTLHFSNTNYWHNNGLISPYNANGASYDGNPYPYVYDSNSNLYNYVEDYVEELITNQGAPSTISGRVLSYEEAEGLGCQYDFDYETGTCSSAQSWVYSTSYWLGSAYGSSLWNVYSGANFFSTSFNYDGSLGLRPVIVVSASEF